MCRDQAAADVVLDVVVLDLAAEVPDPVLPVAPAEEEAPLVDVSVLAALSPGEPFGLEPFGLEPFGLEPFAALERESVR